MGERMIVSVKLAILSAKSRTKEGERFIPIRGVAECVGIGFGSILKGTPFFFVIWLGIGFREEEVLESGAIVIGLPGELQFDGVGEIVTSIDGELSETWCGTIKEGFDNLWLCQVTC